MLGSKCTVTPAAVVTPDGTSTHAPPTIGSFVHIGCSARISALAIGSHVLIGDNAILGNRVDVKSCVVVTSGSVVSPDVTLPSHTVWHGRPAACVSTLHPSFEMLVCQEMKWAFEAAMHSADFSQ